MKRNFWIILLAIALAAASPAGAITDGMTIDEMVAEIISGAKDGGSCEDTMSAITTAVRLDNGNAPDLVSRLAARKDTGCYDNAWLTQRVDDRILTPESAPVLYTDKPCFGPYAVVRAAVAGFDEVNSAGDEDSKARALAPKVLAVLESAHAAVGDDVPGRRCSEAITVGAVAGMGPDTVDMPE